MTSRDLFNISAVIEEKNSLLWDHPPGPYSTVKDMMNYEIFLNIDRYIALSVVLPICGLAACTYGQWSTFLYTDDLLHGSWRAEAEFSTNILIVLYIVSAN